MKLLVLSWGIARQRTSSTIPPVSSGWELLHRAHDGPSIQLPFCALSVLPTAAMYNGRECMLQLLTTYRDVYWSIFLFCSVPLPRACQGLWRTHIGLHWTMCLIIPFIPFFLTLTSLPTHPLHPPCAPPTAAVGPISSSRGWGLCQVCSSHWACSVTGGHQPFHLLPDRCLWWRADWGREGLTWQRRDRWRGEGGLKMWTWPCEWSCVVYIILWFVCYSAQ